MKKPATKPGKITNRRARFDYELGDSLLVGLQLTGAETKALRTGRGSLAGAFVSTKDNELWLVNAQIFAGPGYHLAEDGQTRSRKILAKRREIDRFIADRKQGSTIVPLEILTTGRFIKLRIAGARGKKHHDKREVIKRREQQRDIARNS